MNKSVPEPGTVVRSKAGRDTGRYFVVVEAIDHQYVMVCDGDLRRLANPKKKKLKHLEVKPVSIPTIKEKLLKGGISDLYDAEIRKNLEGLGYNRRERKSLNDFKEG